jgi:hypothetical protein
LLTGYDVTGLDTLPGDSPRPTLTGRRDGKGKREEKGEASVVILLTTYLHHNVFS